MSDTRVLETIREVDVVVLDKTGTATAGEFTLLEAAGDTSRMAELAAVEACSEHPIGKALADRAGGLAAPRHRHPHRAGNQRRGGRHALFPGQPPATGERMPPARPDNLPELDGTVVYFGWDGAIRGALLFGDRIRPEAAGLCAALRARGIRTVLLSGDAALRHRPRRRRHRRRRVDRGSHAPSRRSRTFAPASSAGARWP